MLIFEAPWRLVSICVFPGASEKVHEGIQKAGGLDSSAQIEESDIPGIPLCDSGPGTEPLCALVPHLENRDLNPVYLRALLWWQVMV